MQTLDYIVLVVYFLVLIGIGIVTSMRIKKQEDYFMGGRSFGKLLQTFAAFGAGTGSSDPVNTARTTFTDGMSGMWSVMYWLFVTPFYWITGVWYRRMRHLTLGDWFSERYESKGLGAAYCLFGILFFMVYGSMLFTAIGAVAAPLIERETVAIAGSDLPVEFVLVPIIGLVVLIYGIAGGLEAAYFTDLIQGLCIIALSVVLIPFGLNALIDKFDPESTAGMMHGFKIMHEQIPKEHFNIIGASTGEFPLHRIIAIVLVNLVGIVVQPHFIATGGGSAKTELNARVGLVLGNFLKRFCTVGWVLTALIALALFADHPELVNDPARTWGVAARELLGPGLRGLMLACLLAALMSSVDAYMVVGSALVVRNVYAAYIDPNATEKHYVRLGRVTGAFIVIGAVAIALFMNDVFEQLQLTWIFPVLFGAPFWIGMYWRRATKMAAWCTVIYTASSFFLIPFFAPLAQPQLRTRADLLETNQIVKTITRRPAAPSDVAKRQTLIELWEQQNAAGADDLGERPTALAIGEEITIEKLTGGQGIFWGSGVRPVDAGGRELPDVKPIPVGEPTVVNEQTEQIVLEYPEDTRLRGFGNLKLDFFVYKLLRVDLSRFSNATLDTLGLVPKILLPFLVMILISFITPRNTKEGLDRYYAKMKTPVDPDPEADAQRLENSRQNIDELEQQKLFPGSSLEFQKPSTADVLGFIICFAICFAVIAVAVWIAGIGA